METYRFSASHRVKRNSDFSWIMRRGFCVADGTLVLFAVKRDGNSATRIGITIPKRTGNAVQRNRWKRLVRESFRLHQHEFPVGVDLIVRPKKGAKLIWRDVNHSVPYLVKKVMRRMKADSESNERKT